jgi:hypothetical protein
MLLPPKLITGDAFADRADELDQIVTILESPVF